MMQGSYDYRLLAPLLALAVIGAILLYLLHGWRKADIKRRGEDYFNLLAEAIPQLVWTAIPGGGVDYCNQRFYDLAGLSKDETMGWGWQKALHPDDLPLVLQNWENARQMGTFYDIEFRLRTAAGGYRWHLTRATPMRDSAGTIVKWYGACTDIDDQIRHQQVLEDQISQHMEALMDANARLQSEMRERALAQQELNLQKRTHGAGTHHPLEPGDQPGQDGRIAAELCQHGRRFPGDREHGAEGISVQVFDGMNTSAPAWRSRS